MDMGEKFALALLKGIGIAPDKFKADLALVMGEFHGVKHDREAFKSASAKVIAEFRAELRATNGRLEALEIQGAKIEALLLDLHAARLDVPAPLTNGVNHVQS